MLKILRKIWNILPAVIGTIEALLPLIKEIVVDVIRVLDILTLDDKVADSIIGSVNAIYDAIIEWTERIKNYMLGKSDKK